MKTIKQIEEEFDKNFGHTFNLYMPDSVIKDLIKQFLCQTIEEVIDDVIDFIGSDMGWEESTEFYKRNYMKKEKQFLVSKNYILSEVAKWAVVQSPYHRPDNLEKVLDELDLRIGVWTDDILGYRKMTHKEIKQFIDKELKSIPEFLAWNERKNGNQSQYRFVDRYSAKNNPDDDFIDLDAIIRNVTNSIIREGTEKSIPEILGEGNLTTNK